MKHTIMLLLTCTLLWIAAGCAKPAPPEAKQTPAAAAPITEANPAEPVEETEEPSVYCGNTMTTLRRYSATGTKINEEVESTATFMGSDSVTLTDLLLNLDYDPEKCCKCIPNLEVETEFGRYLLCENYARCDQGQAPLTTEQSKLVQEIIERQL